MILHEVGHKDHWDKARALYKTAPTRYNSLEEAKHRIDQERRSALVRKKSEEPDFISRNVSRNADVGLLYSNIINEFQADYFVRKCQQTVSQELNEFLEGIENDVLAE